MYIIELIVKLHSKFKNGELKFFKRADKVVPEPKQTETVEQCEHILIPIDSTKKILACSKCGFMVKINLEKIKKPNPFKN